ncbi:MAG: type IV toxin-antitoxin system AbiEi family antitoxin domain-containing protein [Marmoricola sp.]
MTTFPNRPVSRRELLESGIPSRRIEAMRRSGELRTVFRGVYVGRDVADSLEMRIDAAGLVLGPDQVVCDRAAAFLHGVDAYGSRESQSRPLETCVRRGGTRTRRQGIDGRERDLVEHDVEARRNVQLTTPLRTALDLGCSLPRHRALGVMDALARFHGFDPISLYAGSRRFRGRRGVLQLRSLIPLVDPRSE